MCSFIHSFTKICMYTHSFIRFFFRLYRFFRVALSLPLLSVVIRLLLLHPGGVEGATSAAAAAAAAAEAPRPPIPAAHDDDGGDYESDNNNNSQENQYTGTFCSQETFTYLRTYKSSLIEEVNRSRLSSIHPFIHSLVPHSPLTHTRDCY